MPSRWKTDRPMSRAGFEARFPGEFADFSAPTLTAFVDGVAAPGATVITDGWRGYQPVDEIARASFLFAERGG